MSIGNLLQRYQSSSAKYSTTTTGGNKPGQNTIPNNTPNCSPLNDSFSEGTYNAYSSVSSVTVALPWSNRTSDSTPRAMTSASSI